MIETALPLTGPFTVQAEAVFSFHAGEIEPDLVISEWDLITHEWRTPYTFNPEIPVVLEPQRDQEVRPNTDVSMLHTLTNTGTAERVFDLTYASEQGWPYIIALNDAPQTPVSNTGPVGPGETVDLVVSTKVTSQMAGAVDTVVVTATAQDAPEVTGIGNG